jgi:outer membrane protein TolC
VAASLPIPASPATAQAATTAETLELEQVVAYALEHNPGLAAAIEQRRELAGGLVEAWADAYPQLDLAAGWNRSRNPSLLNSPDFEDFLEQFPGFEPQTQDLWNLGVELRQVIWAGGKVKATVALAELAAETVENRIVTAKLDVAARAGRAWADAVAADRSRAALRAELASRRTAVALVEARLEIGEATELERLRAVAALASLEPEIAALDGRHDAAIAALRAVMGLPADTRLTVAHEGSETPTLPDLTEALTSALAQRPELFGLRLDERTVAGQAEITRAEGRPRFDFTAGWGRQARLGENLRDGLYDDWRVGISASLSLSDGGKRAGQLARAESQQRQIELRLEELEREVEREVETAWSDLRAALARREAAASSLAAAREAARVARESWELGVALQLDVLEAEDLARQAELAAIDADLAAWAAAIELDRARGTLPSPPTNP